MDETCACGHVADEHEQGGGGPVACAVEDCDCVYFEWDGESGDDAD